MEALSSAPVTPLRPGRALVFIGFMCSGKSTAADEVARALGTEAQDSDGLLETQLGHSIAEEFEAVGEASFRAREEELVCELLARAGPGSVLALGGGSVLSERVQRALRPHLTVLLEVDPAVAWRRATAPTRREQRPLARDRHEFLTLHDQRQPVYERLADAILPAGERQAVRRALPALVQLAAGPGAVRMLWATAASGDYPVWVGQRLLGSELWPFDREVSRPFCVTDETVGALYGERAGPVALTITIPPGETQKSLASAERIWEALASAGMTRADHLLALGGGVVGDLAGFCAATYLRGVPVVQVPTTLVAQIDSALGGKTGLDLPQAKNYVGAYHQPAAVVVDLDTLDTLPEAEASAGYAEVIKTALIAGGRLWERVVAGDPVGADAIIDCIRVKLAVVARDERDAGRRQLLNLGHTVGHAIEAATGYARYRHGEAVGLGLLAALRVSGQDGLREQVVELLAAKGLPVRLDGVGVGAVLEAAGRDKKRVGDRIDFVVVDAPGRARTGVPIAPADLRAAVEELGAA